MHLVTTITVYVEYIHSYDQHIPDLFVKHHLVWKYPRNEVGTQFIKNQNVNRPLILILGLRLVDIWIA